MENGKEHENQKNNEAMEFYSDIPGQPYPELPRRDSETSAWLEGRKKIFERMRQQEKTIIAQLIERLSKFDNENAFSEELHKLQAMAKEIGGQTVGVRNVIVMSPTGQEYNLAVLFRPRREISQKDEVPVFGVMILAL